jgi:hypothetical protein
MKNEIEQWIELDRLELEKQVDLDPFLPQRLRSRLQARHRPSRRLVRKIAWASGYCLILAVLTFIQRQWLPSPALATSPGPSVVKLTPFPAELQNTIYRSFIEVAKWEK